MSLRASFPRVAWDKWQIERDELVKKGLFRSRNEAIWQILGKGPDTFSNEVGRKKTIAAITDRLFLLDRDLGRSPLSLQGIRSRLLESRERL